MYNYRKVEHICVRGSCRTFYASGVGTVHSNKKKKENQGMTLVKTTVLKQLGHAGQIPDQRYRSDPDAEMPMPD